jgi:hypothetical protein
MPPTFSHRIGLSPAEEQEVLENISEAAFHRSVLPTDLYDDNGNDNGDGNDAEDWKTKVAAYSTQDLFEYGGTVAIELDVDYARLFYKLHYTMNEYAANGARLEDLRHSLRQLLAPCGQSVFLTQGVIDEFPYQRLWQSRCQNVDCSCPRIHTSILVVTMIPCLIVYGTTAELRDFQRTFLGSVRQKRKTGFTPADNHSKQDCPGLMTSPGVRREHLSTSELVGHMVIALSKTFPATAPTFGGGLGFRV